MGGIIPFDKLWLQYKRIIKDEGAIVLFGSQPFTSKLICSNIEWFKEELIWQKDRASNFANAKYRHMKYHENILVFAKNRYTYNRQMIERKSERVKQAIKNDNKVFRTRRKDDTEVCFNTDYEPYSFDKYNPKLKNPSTVIYNPIVVSTSKEKLPHPTQKPVKLLEYLVRSFSNENDIILDNCFGVGSIPIACINTNRRFIGFELDTGYFNIANERIKASSVKIPGI